VEISEQQVPAAEMERMMKAQEVILKAAVGKLKWWEAAEIMGVETTFDEIQQIYIRMTDQSICSAISVRVPLTSEWRWKG
jgi:hypothetical protein